MMGQEVFRGNESKKIQSRAFRQELPMTSGNTVRVISTLVAVGVLFTSAVRAGDGVVALQTADPSCPDNSGDIYVDCGNGTVTDNRTGRVWLKNANCAALNWRAAMVFVAGLADMPAGSAAALDDCGLSDGSSPGEWRLPSVAEWEAKIADAVLLGCSPVITDDAGTGCWSPSCNTAGLCALSGVGLFSYWSSSPIVSFPGSAWAMDLVNGGATGFGKGSTLFVWPFRGGQ